MSTLSLAYGLQFRQFEGEDGAVAFMSSSADTHLVAGAGLEMLTWLGRVPHSMSRKQVVAAFLVEGGPGSGGTTVDALALDSLLAELLQSGLLVESNS